MSDRFSFSLADTWKNHKIYRAQSTIDVVMHNVQATILSLPGAMW